MEKIVNNLLIVMFIAVVACGSLQILNNDDEPNETENVSYVQVSDKNRTDVLPDEINNTQVLDKSSETIIDNKEIVPNNKTNIVTNNNQTNNSNNQNNVPKNDPKKEEIVKGTVTDSGSWTSDLKDNQTNNNSNNNQTEDNLQVEEIYTNKDLKVINGLNTLKSDLDDLLAEGNREKLKDQGKLVFITLVDFIFYDGKINDVTFDEMSTAGKQKVLDLTHTIDEKIEKVFPGYKETISSTTSKAFNKASELIAKGADNINNFAKEKLDPELYQDIINDKNELVKYTKNAFSILGDVGSGLFNSAKNWLSNWWQNFKNS